MSNSHIKPLIMSNISFLFYFLFISVYLLVCNDTEEVNCRQNDEQLVAMFVFGDSIYDPGNTNLLNITKKHKANYWPYGETFFHYPTGRFCDGRVIPDFIATYAKLPMWRPYNPTNFTQNFSNGANFAAGGAAVLPGNSQGLIDLTQQLSFFREVAYQMRIEVGEVEANKTLREAIYLNSIGGNDYAVILEGYPNITEPQKEYFVEMIINIISSAIKEIYEMGGRKFMIQNVGPMGCLPGQKQQNGLADGECVEELLSIIKLHNEELVKAVEALESELEGFQYSLFDYYSSLYDIILNPSNYGLKVADVACCGEGTNRGDDCGLEPYELCSNASEYVFFDGSHPGEAANSILSQLLWSGNSTITVPRNLKQLYDLQITSNIVENVINCNNSSNEVGIAVI